MLPVTCWYSRTTHGRVRDVPYLCLFVKVLFRPFGIDIFTILRLISIRTMKICINFFLFPRMRLVFPFYEVYLEHHR